MRIMGSYATRSGGGSGTTLQKGETAFLKTKSNWLNKDGEVVIAQNSDGDYIFKRYFNKETPKVDTDSSEYKQALQQYNVKASFKTDGSVVVTKGGLYQRKATFKSKEAFMKETESRIDKRKSLYQSQLDYAKSGKISQLKAENFKSTLRNNEQSTALKSMKRSMEDSLKTYATNIAAGDDMKQRLRSAVSKGGK